MSAPSPEPQDLPLTGEELSAKKERAILALIAEPTIKRAAESIGMSERTLRRWLDEPAFAQAYSGARRQSFAQGLAVAGLYVPLSVQTLAKTQTDPSAPHSAKVQAAQAILKFVREGIELDDLAQRVIAIEASQPPKDTKKW
jgi:hypothetical protein